MRFRDLVAVGNRPDHAEPAVRRPVALGWAPAASDDSLNNGVATALIDARRGTKLRASRRTFLRSTFAAAAATTATSMAGLFGTSRRVQAQTGVVGAYPRRLLTYCPPYNANDNCQPGCGSSPICTDCCSSDGYFRNDPANGYSLYAGGCGDGDIADGWIWRYNGTCGSCSSIEYRCSDGYIQTDTGPAPFICRAVTDCQPLADGEDPNNQPDLAVQTNWRPAGALESVVDNGGSVSLTGWIADASGQPVDMRVTADNRIVHVGKASLSRPDVAQSVRGAGPNTGFSVSFPIEPGPYRFCVNAQRGAFSVIIGCVELVAGSGQAVRGPGANTSIAGAPADPTATPTEQAAPTPTPDADLTPEPTPAEILAVPQSDDTPPSASPTRGAAQVIRRVGPNQGFVSGWAGDPDSPDPAWIEVFVDGVLAAQTRTDLPRPDVVAARPDLGPTTGFAVSVDLPETEVELCVEMIDPLDGRRTSLGCRRVGRALDPESPTESSTPETSGDPSPAPAVVWGAIDEALVDGTSVVVSGWAVDPNDRARSLDVRISVAGVSATAPTGRAHSGVAERYGITEPCGFEVRLPVPPGTSTVRVTAPSSVGDTTLGETTITA